MSRNKSPDTSSLDLPSSPEDTRNAPQLDASSLRLRELMRETIDVTPPAEWHALQADLKKLKENPLPEVEYRAAVRKIYQSHGVSMPAGLASEEILPTQVDDGILAKLRAIMLPDNPYADAVLLQIVANLMCLPQTIRSRIAVMRRPTLRPGKPSKEGLITEGFKSGNAAEQLAFAVREKIGALAHIWWECVSFGAKIFPLCTWLLVKIIYVVVSLTKSLTELERQRNAVELKAADYFLDAVNPFAINRHIPIEDIVANKRSSGVRMAFDLPGEIAISRDGKSKSSHSRLAMFWRLTPESLTGLPTTERTRVVYAIQRLGAVDIRALLNAIRDCTRTDKLSSEDIVFELTKALEHECIRTKRGVDANVAMKVALPTIADALAARNLKILQAQTYLQLYPDIAKLSRQQKNQGASPDRWSFDIDDTTYGGKRLSLEDFLQRMKQIDLQKSSVHPEVEALLRGKGLEGNAATGVRIAIVDNDIPALSGLDRSGENTGAAPFRTAPTSAVTLAAQFAATKKQT